MSDFRTKAISLGPFGTAWAALRVTIDELVFPEMFTASLNANCVQVATKGVRLQLSYAI